MRQLVVQVPAHAGLRVLEIAGRFQATNSASLPGTDADGASVAVVLLHVPNDAVGPLLDALGVMEPLRVSMIPQGALALHPPADEVHDQVEDVTARAPLEVFVAGLQSIGSWTGLLGYAMVGGAVAWLGLRTNSVYLLVGAMLIAPFAGPAVNTAIATARGDARLLRHALLRYAVAIVVTASTAGVLSLAFGLKSLTSLMRDVSIISNGAVLVPVMAGAAVALHLVQGSQSSLVSGAAAGMLIAASLAPPAALLGVAVVVGHFEVIAPALFILALQLAGINLAGGIVFGLFGLTPDGVRISRGQRHVRALGFAATVAGLAALLWWQFGTSTPAMQRATIEQRSRDAVLLALRDDREVEAIRADVQFTAASTAARPPLLAMLYVRRRIARASDPATSDSALAARVEDRVRPAIVQVAPNVAPLLSVTVVHH